MWSHSSVALCVVGFGQISGTFFGWCMKWLLLLRGWSASSRKSLRRCRPVAMHQQISDEMQTSTVILHTSTAVTKEKPEACMRDRVIWGPGSAGRSEGSLEPCAALDSRSGGRTSCLWFPCKAETKDKWDWAASWRTKWTTGAFHSSVKNIDQIWVHATF